MRLNFSRKKIKLPIWFLSFVLLNFVLSVFAQASSSYTHANQQTERRRAHAVASDSELCSVFNWFKLPWVIWEREWGWKWTRKRERFEREINPREKNRNENFMKCEYSGNNNGRSISISSIKHTNTQFGMVSIRCVHLKHSIMYFHMSGVSLSVPIGKFFFFSFDCTHNQFNTHTYWVAFAMTSKYSSDSPCTKKRVEYSRVEKEEDVPQIIRLISIYTCRQTLCVLWSLLLGCDVVGIWQSHMCVQRDAANQTSFAFFGVIFRLKITTIARWKRNANLFLSWHKNELI